MFLYFLGIFEDPHLNHTTSRVGCFAVTLLIMFKQSCAKNRDLAEHWAETTMNLDMDFVHLLNLNFLSINIWLIDFVVISIYFKASENIFVILRHFWYTDNYICLVPRTWDRSKFLYQDANVIPLTEKCTVVRKDVYNYNVLVDMGKLSDNLSDIEHVLLSGVDRVFKSSYYTFQNISDRLNPLGKSVDFDNLFLGSPSGLLLICVSDDIKFLVPWKWDRFNTIRFFHCTAVAMNGKFWIVNCLTTPFNCYSRWPSYVDLQSPCNWTFWWHVLLSHSFLEFSFGIGVLSRESDYFLCFYR